MSDGRGGWRSAVELTLLAGCLRFLRLGAWSLWIDEGNTLWLTQHLSGKRPTDAYPLFFWLERGMVELFGTGEFALRLLPAILGILTVPLLYLAFRKAAGERAAFWGALLLALSPWHLFWSQNARYYTLLMVEALVMFRLAWAWWEGGGWKHLAGLALVGLAGLMTQYTLLLAWPALMLYPLVARLTGHARDGRFAWRRIFLFAGALALPALLAAGRMIAFSGEFASIPRHYGDNPLRLVAALAFRLGLPICVAVLIGAIAGLRMPDMQRRRFALFAVSCAAVPALLAALASFKVIATSYYVFFALPMFLLLAGLALEEIPRRGRMALVAGLLLAAFYAQGLALYFTVHHGDRIRWREAVEFVQKRIAPGDRIIGAGSEAVSYYLGESPALLNETERQTMIQWRLEPEWSDPQGPTWYILNDQLIAELDEDGRFRDFLRERCTLMREYPLWNATKNRTARVYFYSPEQARALASGP